MGVVRRGVCWRSSDGWVGSAAGSIGWQLVWTRPRYQTLRAAIDWSYALLGDQERPSCSSAWQTDITEAHIEGPIEPGVSFSLEQFRLPRDLHRVRGD